MKNIKKTPYIPEISLIQSANRTTMINKGCLLEGTVALARAPGTFDFSLGSSIAYSKDYVFIIFLIIIILFLICIAYTSIYNGTIKSLQSIPFYQQIIFWSGNSKYEQYIRRC